MPCRSGQPVTVCTSGCTPRSPSCNHMRSGRGQRRHVRLHPRLRREGTARQGVPFTAFALALTLAFTIALTIAFTLIHPQIAPPPASCPHSLTLSFNPTLAASQADRSRAVRRAEQALRAREVQGGAAEGRRRQRWRQGRGRDGGRGGGRGGGGGPARRHEQGSAGWSLPPLHEPSRRAAQGRRCSSRPGRSRAAH